MVSSGKIIFFIQTQIMMKFPTSQLLKFLLLLSTSIVSLFFISALSAQSIHLDVEGHSRIVGNLDISHPDDSTTIFIGRNAGIHTTFESRRKNTFVGFKAGHQNSTGRDNCFFGNESGRENTEGDENAFYGFHAGLSNTIGFSNAFFGTSAGGSNIDGYANSFFGNGAGCEHESGSFNSFFGDYAGEYHISGGQNSFFGESSGGNSISGTRNTYLGASADQVGDSLDRAIAIGYNAKVACSNCAVIGGTGVNAVKVGIGITHPKVALEVGEFGDGTRALANKWDLFSDQRWKRDLVRIDDPLTKLQTISGYYYYWKNGKDTTRQVGVIAQEIEKVLPEVVSTDTEGYKSVEYGKLSALLIEVIKEQQSRINTLEASHSHIVHLKDENKQLYDRLKQVEQKLDLLITAQNQTP